MDSFRMSDLRQLTEPHEGPCVTICMPTHIAGVDGQQDAVRLKNLADQVEQQLIAEWVRAADARDLIQRAKETHAWL